MDRTIFRAYSIRGVSGKTLTPTDMLAIGQAAGTMLSTEGIPHAVVGRDYRLSSAELSAALNTGLVSTGMHLTDIGTCPTPLLNFATDHYRAGAGLMVTASHNPPQYNGLKIRTDHTLCDDELQTLYKLAQSGEFRRGDGTVSYQEPLGEYLDAICRAIRTPPADQGSGVGRRTTQAHQTHDSGTINSRTLRLVVDAGNGAAGPVVPHLLERLGCQTLPLHCVPDGRFPARVPDPTAPGALDELAAWVVAEKADAGLAYDGDGDRLAMVDDRGQVVYADRLLILLAQEALTLHPGATIVHDVSCTQALQETVEALGGHAVPCPVGYAFVHEAMRVTSAVLGGEAAGHIFFGDREFTFDDAILATAKMVALMSRAGVPLSTLLSRLPQYLRAPQLRLHCPDELKSPVVAGVSDHFSGQGYPVDRLDGAKIHFDEQAPGRGRAPGHGRTPVCGRTPVRGGWALFRASNTQPAVTLHCEATTATQLDQIRDTMVQTIRETLAGLGIEMTNAR